MFAAAFLDFRLFFWSECASLQAGYTLLAIFSRLAVTSLDTISLVIICLQLFRKFIQSAFVTPSWLSLLFNDNALVYRYNDSEDDHCLAYCRSRGRLSLPSVLSVTWQIITADHAIGNVAGDHYRALCRSRTSYTYLQSPLTPSRCRVWSAP